ncbi:uncharacterized protein VTP21DRAFT_523 [Calcarisporiella thermophila]|uniref:uncharacterized protein n=1 Tax=Calcarisporiella thermophila TaxID=911321 RepID=UPI003741ED43
MPGSLRESLRDHDNNVEFVVENGKTTTSSEEEVFFCMICSVIFPSSLALWVETRENGGFVVCQSCSDAVETVGNISEIPSRKQNSRPSHGIDVSMKDSFRMDPLDFVYGRSKTVKHSPKLPECFLGESCYTDRSVQSYPNSDDLDDNSCDQADFSSSIYKFEADLSNCHLFPYDDPPYCPELAPSLDNIIKSDEEYDF